MEVIYCSKGEKAKCGGVLLSILEGLAQRPFTISNFSTDQQVRALLLASSGDLWKNGLP